MSNNTNQVRAVFYDLRENNIFLSDAMTTNQAQGYGAAMEQWGPLGRSQRWLGWLDAADADAELIEALRQVMVVHSYRQQDPISNPAPYFKLEDAFAVTKTGVVKQATLSIEPRWRIECTMPVVNSLLLATHHDLARAKEICDAYASELGHTVTVFDAVENEYVHEMSAC